MVRVKKISDVKFLFQALPTVAIAKVGCMLHDAGCKVVVLQSCSLYVP